MAARSSGLASRSQSALETVEEVLAVLSARSRHDDVLTAIKHFPARQAQFRPMPAWVRPELVSAYRAKGIDRLYSHQAAAAELAHGGKDFVVVTPTASGKTLCYNLPILNSILENPDTRALYLFPTKALAQDQLAELHDLATRLQEEPPGRRLGEPGGTGSFGVFTYDGDTPSDARKAIRERAHVILTNPDMLHTGILPHHTKWMRLFENLRCIVIDELHTYRGVFGSHLANVLRRLARIARFYGSAPQFICCSATIANPGELASQLIERPVEAVEENGAPAAEKLFVFYNPPMVNRNLGIRRSYLNETARVSKELLARKLQTIVFANSRLHTEVLLTYLQQANPPQPGAAEPVRGYRGGYLPGERREIERGLREGRVRGVVATSALELGIDIGSLDACVMAGYAGSIASTWQRAGRAGRRSGTSCAVFVASSAPLDQFIVQHPEYFFGRSPEHAYIQPDNLEILVNHLKCAAFELPIASDEKFGGVDLSNLCERLAEAGFFHRSGGNWHWVQEAYPADTVSLRSVTSDNFVIVETAAEDDGNLDRFKKGGPEVIGEVDFSSALTTVHPKAIYLHQGQQYHVEHLDFDRRKAYVKPVNVDYYTDAIRYTQVRVLEIAEEEQISLGGRSSRQGTASAVPHAGREKEGALAPEAAADPSFRLPRANARGAEGGRAGLQPRRKSADMRRALAPEAAADPSFRLPRANARGAEGGRAGLQPRRKSADMRRALAPEAIPDSSLEAAHHKVSSFRAEGPDGLASPDEVRSGPAARNLSSIAPNSEASRQDAVASRQGTASAVPNRTNPSGVSTPEVHATAAGASRAHGDVLVRSQVIGFKKIKFFTNENVGDGKLELPENEMHTTAFWITLDRELLEALPFPLSDKQSGIFGFLYALESMAALLLMCDRRDLGTAVGERPPSASEKIDDGGRAGLQPRRESADMRRALAPEAIPDSPFHAAHPAAETEWQEFTGSLRDAAATREFFEPNLYIYDAYPGGIGFSEPLYRVYDLLLRRTQELIAACPCENGCPSCVGPAGEKAERAKEATLAILERLCS